MNKFKYLLSYNLRQRFFSKTFLVLNIIILALTVLLANLNNIIKSFAPEDSRSTVLVVDNTGKTNFLEDYSTLSNQMSKMLMGSGFALKPIDTFDKENPQFDGAKAIIEASYVDEKLIIDVYSRNLGTVDVNALTQASHALYKTYWMEGKTPEEIELIGKYLTLESTVSINHQEESSNINQIGMILSFILIVPLFMFITMTVQFVGGSIVEEKQTKAVEYLLANVSARVHFFTKILTSMIYLVVQMLLTLLYGLIGLVLSMYVFGSATAGGGSLTDLVSGAYGIDASLVQQFLKILPGALIFFILFVAVGGLLYMLIAALIAAMSNSSEDYSATQTPMMLTMLVGFYAGLYGSMIGDNIVVKILGYIPFFSPFMSTSLFLSGIYQWWEALISLGILALFTAFMYRLIMPMYKAAILNYDQSKFIKRVKNVFKRSKNQ